MKKNQVVDQNALDRKLKQKEENRNIFEQLDRCERYVKPTIFNELMLMHQSAIKQKEQTNKLKIKDVEGEDRMEKTLNKLCCVYDTYLKYYSKKKQLLII